jgi:hypothetical protein
MGGEDVPPEPAPQFETAEAGEVLLRSYSALAKQGVQFARSKWYAHL